MGFLAGDSYLDGLHLIPLRRGSAEHPSCLAGAGLRLKRSSVHWLTECDIGVVLVIVEGAVENL
jgi:hypothetical protein